MKINQSIKQLSRQVLAIPLLAMSASAASERPNILYLFTDDQTHRSVSAYPEAYPYANTPNIDRLASHGVSFSNAYVGTRCAPSRASTLTGRLQINVEPGSTRYWPQDFRADGYTTAMIGKWHWGKGAEAHQHGTAWDWSVVWDHGAGDAAGDYYNNQLVMIDGAPQVSLGGYSTDRYTDYMLQFLQEQETSEKPWLMWLCYSGVHGPYTPADRHIGTLTDAEQTPVPSDIFGPRPGKPDYINMLTKWSDTDLDSDTGPSTFDLAVKEYNEAVMSIDESVGVIFAALEASGELENTIIIFSSDQGYAWGQHGLKDKRYPYEAALRSPLIFYAPDRFATNAWTHHPVNGPDITRTIHTLAGVDPVIPMDGRDFSQLLVEPDHDETWTDAPMVQIFTENEYGPVNIEQYLADENWAKLDWNQNAAEGTPYWILTHDGRYKYTRYMAWNHMEELYDLQTDPDEITNLALRPEFNAKVLELRAATVERFRALGADFVDLLPEPSPLLVATYLKWVNFEADTVGSAPTGSAGILEPANSSVLVVGSAVNTAGTGNGLEIMSDGSNPHLLYDFVGTTEEQVSAFRVDFNFADIGATSENSYTQFSLSYVGSAMTSDAMRNTQLQLYDDGRIRMQQDNGDLSPFYNTLVGTNAVSVFVNDYDADTVSYIGPDASARVLAPNSIAYWLNGTFLIDLQLDITEGITAGAIGNGENNFGRLGFIAPEGSTFDFVIDDIVVTTEGVEIEAPDDVVTFSDHWGFTSSTDNMTVLAESSDGFSVKMNDSDKKRFIVKMDGNAFDTPFQVGETATWSFTAAAGPDFGFNAGEGFFQGSLWDSDLNSENGVTFQVDWGAGTEPVIQLARASVADQGDIGALDNSRVSSSGSPSNIINAPGDSANFVISMERTSLTDLVVVMRYNDLSVTNSYNVAASFDSLNELGFRFKQSGDNALIISQMKLTITTPILEPDFESWATAKGLTPGVNDGPNDDAENDGVGDGMENLLEYALGGDPLVNDAAEILPTVESNGSLLNFSYKRPNPADPKLSYTVFDGTDFLDGRLNNTNSSETVSGVVDGFETVTNTISTDAVDRIFMQLKVEMAD